MKFLLSAALLLLAQDDDDAKLQKEIEYANSGKLQFEGQAVQRLKARGPAAVPALVAWVRLKGANALSAACADLFAEIEDPALAALCAELLQNREFYWRPAAARGLAAQKSPAHRDLLRRSLRDVLWGVRAAAVKGLELLGDRESAPEIKRLLDDETYDVRAQAAKTLHAFGDESGLGVLVESLKSDVAWFDIDYGQLAREDAVDFLKGLAGTDFGFKAWDPAADREAGLRKWDEWMSRRRPAWRDELPPNARVVPDASTYEFGFELRSCLTGDYFFRLDSEGRLVLGFFNLRKAPLSAEERASFDRALAAVRKVNRAVPYGQPGCDFEQYYLRQGARFERLWIGRRGRPGDLDGFHDVVAGLLAAKFGEGEAKEFRERTALFREAD